MFIPSPILVICAGNLCRSPFAEAYMRQQLKAAGVEAEVFSRGLLVLPNQRPPDVAQQTATEFGIDLSAHASQPLLSTDLDRAGLVLVMDQNQRRHLLKIRPACISKIFLLSQFAGGNPVHDPMGGDHDAFCKVYTEITAQVDTWMRRFGI